MHHLGTSLSTTYQIAGYTLTVRKERGAPAVYCSDVMDAFSSRTLTEQPDFTLTIKSGRPVNWLSAEQHLAVSTDGVVMQYKTDSEYFYLESDFDLKHWDLYTIYSDHIIGDWFNKAGNLFAWAMPGKGAIVLHGIIMEWQGNGIVLSAASGTGKTTHARLWRDLENALIINGDHALLRKENGLWYACGTPWSGTSGECVNRRVSLDAIVFLSQGNENRVTRISPISAIGKALPRMLAPQWHSQYAEAAVDLAIQCLEKVPVFELSCLPDADSVRVLKEALLREL